MKRYDKIENYLSEILNAPKGFGGIDANDIKDLFTGNEEIHAIEASVEATLGNRTEQLMEQIKKESKSCEPFNHCLVFFFFPEDYPLMMSELQPFYELIELFPDESLVKWGMAVNSNDAQPNLRAIVLLQQNRRTV